MPDKETRTVPLGLRITPTLKAAIDKAAADNERSVASYIERVVSEHLRKKGLSQIGDFRGASTHARPFGAWRPNCHDLPMSDVDWLALWAEFAQATDNKQLEVAERIVYLDGRWDFTELSSSKLIAAARQIIRERVEERS